jgi:hypothetical protein
LLAIPAQFQYAVTIWLPTNLRTLRGVSVIGTGGYPATTKSGAFASDRVAARLSDRIGLRSTYFLFTSCSALIAVSDAVDPIRNAQMLVVGLPLGSLVSANFSSVGA